MATNEHSALQLDAEPTSVSVVQASVSSHEVGQSPSHVSGASTTLFPQLAEQSSSVVALHPLGQQPSPSVQAVMLTNEHSALQLDAAPTSVSVVQAIASSHEVGQSPSHVSGASTVPFPQLAEQSSSVVTSHPPGQQPSPSWQLVIGVDEHTALHSSAEPVSSSAVQAVASSHVVGQSPSQTSEPWTTPSPHSGPPSMGPSPPSGPASAGPPSGVAESATSPASTPPSVPTGLSQALTSKAAKLSRQKMGAFIRAPVEGEGRTRVDAIAVR
jgi:hypothetical protein